MDFHQVVSMVMMYDFLRHSPVASWHKYRLSNFSSNYRTMSWPLESKGITFIVWYEWLLTTFIQSRIIHLQQYAGHVRGQSSRYILSSSLTFLQPRHRDFAPSYNGRYLSSNVNITYVDSNGSVVNTPVGCMTYFLLSWCGHAEQSS
jgi:hypothetical protein